MSKKSRLIIFIVGLLFVISTACSVPAGLLDYFRATATTPNGSATQAPLVVPPLLNPVKSTPDPKPAPFQESLGSLDSYRLTIHFLTSDSTGAKTVLDQFVESSVIDGNTHTLMTTVNRAPEDTEDATSTTEIYSLGTVTCTLSGNEWSYQKQTEQDKEIKDIFSQMIDFTPVIKDPLFVGAEVVNGVQTNHFSFKISGIGAKSGSVATQNQGDYWLAVDGQYIIKYALTLEIQSADAKVANMVVNYDLSAINQPVVLSMPAGCQPPAQ
jgi:hypothetical protein